MAHPSTANALLELIGSLWAVIVLVALFVFGLVWPLMLFSITMNIRGIRKELRDIAEQLSMPSRRV